MDFAAAASRREGRPIEQVSTAGNTKKNPERFTSEIGLKRRYVDFQRNPAYIESV